MCTDTTPWSTSQYLAAAATVGLPASNFVPSSLESLCENVASGSVPPGAPKTFETVCTASLIARGIIYFKCNPGDCGTPTQLDLTGAQITGAVGNIVNGIASMAGTALPGIGVAVQAIQQIFAAHAQAVANEQLTICKVANVINQVIPYYDAYVRAGRIAPQAAYVGMQNFFQQCIQGLAAIEKTCNASCVYTAIIQAHYNFVEKYYPLIAPPTASPSAPGAPPIGYEPSAPGSVIQNGGSPIYYGSPAIGPVAASASPVTVGGIAMSTDDLLIGAVAVLVLMILLRQ